MCLKYYHKIKIGNKKTSSKSKSILSRLVKATVVLSRFYVILKCWVQILIFFFGGGGFAVELRKSQ